MTSDFDENKIKEYRRTESAVETCLGECGNFGDLDFCRSFGCEYVQRCKELMEEYGFEE